MFSIDDIDTSKPCTCEITVDDVRIRFRKAEYQVVVRMTFHSNKSIRSKYMSTWCIWRSFSAFRALDAQLRKRNTVHMKGIQFPPLYLRRRLFRTHLQPKFLETRRKSLETYMTMVTQNPATVAFHITSLESQSLKSFVSFTSGFVQNIVQQPTSANARSSNQPPFPKPSTASVSMMASYRWSGTGFLGSDHVNPRARGEKPSSSFVRIIPEQYNQNYMERQSFAGASSGLVLPLSSTSLLSSCRRFTSTRGDLHRHDHHESSDNSDNHTLHRIDCQHEHRKASSSGIRPPPHPTAQQRQSIVKVTATNSQAIDGNGGSSDLLRSSKLIAVTAPTFVNPIVERERGKMELELRSVGLQGVGMPPDGSCFLHCLIYELFPLKWNCFEQYPSHMTMVNVGAADGVAPRRMEAAAMLRKEISAFGKIHVRRFSAFLHTPEDELAQRYETFGVIPDEQATVAELYAAATMLDLELILITNDPVFQIDPVTAVEGIPSIRTGGNAAAAKSVDVGRRSITLGYIPPTKNNGGHYICTRERSNGLAPLSSSFSASSSSSLSSSRPMMMPFASSQRSMETASSSSSSSSSSSAVARNHPHGSSKVPTTTVA